MKKRRGKVAGREPAEFCFIMRAGNGNGIWTGLTRSTGFLNRRQCRSRGDEKMWFRGTVRYNGLFVMISCGTGAAARGTEEMKVNLLKRRVSRDGTVERR